MGGIAQGTRPLDQHAGRVSQSRLFPEHVNLSLVQAVSGTWITSEGYIPQRLLELLTLSLMELAECPRMNLSQHHVPTRASPFSTLEKRMKKMKY